MKTHKTWRLPAPERVDGNKVWYHLVRVGRTIPFGYEEDPNDPEILLPIQDELELYEQAKKFLKQYSYRDVANWLSNESGRYMSHVGLYKRVKLEEKYKREASNQRYLAERYKKALEKAEKLEEKIRRGSIGAAIAPIN